MVISLINQKGGVGKTTNTIHLGARLADLGYKTLLIDFDSQCDLSHGTGVRSSAYTVINFLNGSGDFKLKRRAENFFILPGDVDFVASQFKRFSLKEKLNPLREHFDFILIDCPPAGINQYDLTPAEIALCACDYFLIPLEAKEYPVKNANSFLGKVFSLVEKFNKDLIFVGFFFSNVLVTRKNITKYSDMLKEHTENLLFETFIRADTQVENAIGEGKTIFQFEPNCRASVDFKNLTDEFIRRIDYGKK